MSMGPVIAPVALAIEPVQSPFAKMGLIRSIPGFTVERFD
jgi:hypothetical protein